jgi:hypothetical protein
MLTRASDDPLMSHTVVATEKAVDFKKFVLSL